MLRKLRRLSQFLLRLALVCLALSVVVFLVSTPSQLTPRQKAVSQRDPFPWEAEMEGEADNAEFRGPKRNLQTALVTEDAFTQPAHNHQRSKYNYTVVQQARQMALDGACREQTITREAWQDLSPAMQAILAQRIIVNDRHKLLFCPVALTATGPWMKVMYMLERGQHIQDMADIPSKELANRENFAYLSSYSPSEQEERVSSYLKFMVARHPFIRLATAYKMKFEANNAFFHERYGREIVRLYRSRATGQETGSDVKFTEFVEYLLHLEDVEEMNEHWQPLQALCRPCEVGYDYILHYETLSTDSSELLTEAGLSRQVPTLPHDVWDHVSTQYVNTLFQHITPAWIGQLVHKYQDDFAMFSYGSIF